MAIEIDFKAAVEKLGNSRRTNQGPERSGDVQSDPGLEGVSASVSVARPVGRAADPSVTGAMKQVLNLLQANPHGVAAIVRNPSLADYLQKQAA